MTDPGDATVVNDVHSRLNATHVERIVRPRDAGEVVTLIKTANAARQPLAISGGRHAMGGQQFLEDAPLLDMRAMDRVVCFDAERGLITLEAGAMWRAVVDSVRAMDDDHPTNRWAIRQKQTGADDLTLGGAVSCNAHGRGLKLGPVGEDIESLTVVTPDASVVRCSRDQESELFSLVIGGYGLFGVVVEVTLRLAPRRVMRRIVDLLDIDDAIGSARRRASEGCDYGDFQYSIDPADDGFLRRGISACYMPADDPGAVPDGHGDLKREDWLKLLALAHTDKREAFRLYCQHYIASHGRMYWSDTMQLSTYIPSYSEFLSAALAKTSDAAAAADRPDESLVIGEMSVPPERLPVFLAASRRVLRESAVEDIYGTIRAIQPDHTSFLPWAIGELACVIFNLRTPHTPGGIARTHATFARLIDAALDLGGVFYLTYARNANAQQVLRAYPHFPEFLARKRLFDPRGVLQSEWFRHYDCLFRG
jgi:FAD/FMN-containing dehydrogenase